MPNDAKSSQDKTTVGYCCNLRHKIILSISGTVPEKLCGISDVVLVDVMRFDDLDIGFTIVMPYCPWCGMKVHPDAPTRITDSNGSWEVKGTL